MLVLLLGLVALCLGNDSIPNIDPYEVLGVPRTASQSDIRNAYRRLALQYHPDKNTQEDTSDIFTNINVAYDILGTNSVVVEREEEKEEDRREEMNLLPEFLGS